MFGRFASLALAIAAIVGVFVEILIVSNYAFWVLVGAYFLWLGVNKPKGSFFKWALSIVLLLVAIVAVFIDIPIVSNYAFWIMAANYLFVVANS
jgi:hypothetical protein